MRVVQVNLPERERLLCSRIELWGARNLRILGDRNLFVCRVAGPGDRHFAAGSFRALRPVHTLHPTPETLNPKPPTSCPDAGSSFFIFFTLCYRSQKVLEP